MTARAVAPRLPDGLSTDYVPLTRDDLAAGVPFGFDLYDADGARCCRPAGAARCRAACLPVRPFPAGTTARRRRSRGRAACLTRCLTRRGWGCRRGFDRHPPPGRHDPRAATLPVDRHRRVGRALFVEPQPAAALDFAPGDDIEDRGDRPCRGVAVRRDGRDRCGRRVPRGSWCCRRPASSTGCARARAARAGADRRLLQAGRRVEGIGMVHDISLSGLSIAVDRPIAATGGLARAASVRGGRPGRAAGARRHGAGRPCRPAAPALTLHHAAFGETGADDLIRLKALLFDRLMASSDTDRRR